MPSVVDRPAVAVILPFVGDESQADAVLARLARLRVARDDELILADNSDDAVALRRAAPDGIRVLACPVKRSAYAARNFGAESSRAPWLLFVDGDCDLPPDLLDRYFDSAPPERCGALAGQVLGVPDQPGLIPRYIRSRQHLDQDRMQTHPHRPMAVTANLLVRRSAWQQLGGFAERTRSGADADFCWRLQDAGWTLDYSDRALVHHEHRSSLRELLRQARRDGAGGRWLARRHPGFPSRFGVRTFLRALVGLLAWPLLGRPQRGLFKGIDGLWAAATNVGAVEGNAPPEPRLAPADLVVVVDAFPALDDPLVDTLAAARAAGARIRVEARRRPARMSWAEGRHVPMQIWEDDGPVARARASIAVWSRGVRSGPELAAPGRRLARAAPHAKVVAEPELLPLARRLVHISRRADLSVEALTDRRSVAAS